MHMVSMVTGQFVRTLWLVVLTFVGFGAYAETRPWGNLKPVTPDEVQPENNASGYQGKYNPWKKLVPESEANRQQQEEVNVWGRDKGARSKGYEYSTRQTQEDKGVYRRPNEPEVQQYPQYQPLPSTPYYNPYYEPYYGYEGPDSEGRYGEHRGNSMFPFGNNMWPGSWSFY